MKYLMLGISVIILSGIANASIFDTGIVKSDYSDASIHRQAILSQNGVIEDIETIKIDTDINKIVL